MNKKISAIRNTIKLALISADKPLTAQEIDDLTENRHSASAIECALRTMVRDGGGVKMMPGGKWQTWQYWKLNKPRRVSAISNPDTKIIKDQIDGLVNELTAVVPDYAEAQSLRGIISGIVVKHLT